MTLELEEETSRLLQCFIEVQNEVGTGRHEGVYHSACKVWFEEHRLPVVSKLPHRLTLRGEPVSSLLPDFVGWNAVSIELKAVARKLTDGELVQLFNYLKFRGDRVGLLVNMGLSRVGVKRIAYSPPEATWAENWESWTGHIDCDDRQAGVAVRDAMRAIYSEHSTGYGDEVLAELIKCALRQQGLAVMANPTAKAWFRGVEIHESPLECLLVNGRIVLTVTALFDSIELSVNRGRSYSKALDLRWGVAVNFGKTHVDVVGLRRG